VALSKCPIIMMQWTTPLRLPVPKDADYVQSRVLGRDYYVLRIRHTLSCLDGTCPHQSKLGLAPAELRYREDEAMAKDKKRTRLVVQAGHAGPHLTSSLLAFEEE
jgi:hypothetical protein